jgi:hypothetical protein
LIHGEPDDSADVRSPDNIETHAAAKARIPDEHTRSVARATSHLERNYDASPGRVWKALTDPAAKSQWFGVASEQVEIELTAILLTQRVFDGPELPPVHKKCWQYAYAAVP